MSTNLHLGLPSGYLVEFEVLTVVVMIRLLLLRRTLLYIVNRYIIVIILIFVDKEVCTKQLSVACSTELCGKKVCCIPCNERAQP
jgi:hypothetical protein